MFSFPINPCFYSPSTHVFIPIHPISRPWDKDRFMSPDIEAATKLLREGRVWTAAEPHISHYKTTANEPPPKRIKLVHQS